MSDEQDTSINSVQAPVESTSAVPSEPVQTEVIQPEPAPVVPVPATPEPTPAPVSASLKSFLGKAMEKIQFRKRAKLAKIVKLAVEKKSITNDDVQKLLRVSDATATRYLSELAKKGGLKRFGVKSTTRFEPTLGSNGGN